MQGQNKMRMLGLTVGLLSLTSFVVCDCRPADAAAVSAGLRVGYSDTDDGAGTHGDSLSVGGRLDAVSASWQGLRVGGTVYATTPFGGLNDDPLFLNAKGGPNGTGYAILGQLWIQAEMQDTRLKMGRQEIDTPFADTDDIGMIPNTFEGVVLTDSSFEHWDLTAAHLRRWAGVDANKENFTRINGSHGMWVLGASHSRDNWDLQAWYCRQQGGTDIFYLEGGVEPVDQLYVGLQWARQHDSQANTHASVWGASLG